VYSLKGQKSLLRRGFLWLSNQEEGIQKYKKGKKEAAESRGIRKLSSSSERGSLSFRKTKPKGYHVEFLLAEGKRVPVTTWDPDEQEKK